MKIYPTKVECVDDAKDLVFTVESLDETVAGIDLHQTAHNKESLGKLCNALRYAFAMLEMGMSEDENGKT